VEHYTHQQFDQQLPQLVERMVASYLGDPRTQRIDCEFVPSTRRIVEICDLLLELSFPGFFGRKSLTSNNIGYHVGELLPKLLAALAPEIDRCLCFERERCAESREQVIAEQCDQQALRITQNFIERIPEVRRLLSEDVQAAFDGDPAAKNTQEVILAYPGLIAVTIHRFAHELYKLDVPVMPRIMSEHAHQRTGIDIHPGAQIGRRFFIDHGTGVVIGETTVIGDNVKLYQGVTLGALSFPRNEDGSIIRGQKRHPTVGNHVTIYANAIVLGGETEIGDGAVIGGSVFLTKSVGAGQQVSITPPVLRFKDRNPSESSQAQDSPKPATNT
jgi:serine O-acetyltransferase